MVAGILRDKTKADKLITSPMMIHKITPSVDYNRLNSLDAQLKEPTNRYSIKVPMVIQPTNKKTPLQDFGN